jgi:hypothetical protein
VKIINLYFGLGAVGVVACGVVGVGEGEGAGEVGEGVAAGEVGEGVAAGEVVVVGVCAGGCVRSSATAASITSITTIPAINPVFIELGIYCIYKVFVAVNNLLDSC